MEPLVAARQIDCSTAVGLGSNNKRVVPFNLEAVHDIVVVDSSRVTKSQTKQRHRTEKHVRGARERQNFSKFLCGSQPVSSALAAPVAAPVALVSFVTMPTMRRGGEGADYYLHGRCVRVQNLSFILLLPRLPLCRALQRAIIEIVAQGCRRWHCINYCYHVAVAFVRIWRRRRGWRASCLKPFFFRLPVVEALVVVVLCLIKRISRLPPVPVPPSTLAPNVAQQQAERTNQRRRRVQTHHRRAAAIALSRSAYYTA